MKLARSVCGVCVVCLLALAGCNAQPDAQARAARLSATALTPDGLPPSLCSSAPSEGKALHPAADAAAASGAGVQRGASLVLVGTVASGNDVFAIVKESASGEVWQLRKGDEVEGMRVSTIEPERVALVDAAATEGRVVRVVMPSTAPPQPVAPLPKALVKAAVPPPIIASAPHYDEPTYGQDTGH